MLTIGGYINILISLAHLVGLLWAEKMFEVTGIDKEMADLSYLHPALPYLITVLVAIAFFLFGLYGLAADGKFRKLPLLKPGVFAIAAIYLFRGLGELLFDIEKQEAGIFLETLYSLLAVAIGLLFLFGGLKKWKLIRD